MAPSERPAGSFPDARQIFLGALLFLAVFYTLYFARPVVLPLTIAILLNFLFSPVVRWLRQRWRIPNGVSAALVIVLLLGGMGITVYNLAAPAAAWVARAPESYRRVEAQFRKLRKPVEQVSRTAERVEQMTGMTDTRTPTVQVRSGGLSATLFGSTQSFLFGMVLVFTLLYFLLAQGDFFTEKLVRVLPRVRDRRLALTIAGETEQSVSAYLGTTTLVNAGLGILTGIAMWLLGLPNPELWGLVGGLLNFVPYVGGLVATVVFAMAGMATFDTLGRALLPAITYLVLTNVESFLTPVILGRRLTLNPVVIFLAVVFWGWLWGIPGALIAVPLVATLKIFCDHLPALSGLGEFLGK
ncbi:MAG: AI-2E family transporter [Gemmatimonadales bacterium]